MNKLKLLFSLLEGRKTYLVACATALWAVSGFIAGKFGLTETVNYLLTAGATIGFRSALEKM